MTQEDITLCMLTTIMIMILYYVLFRVSKCKRCNKILKEDQIKYGYYREYKCKKCGNIRKEQGFDY